MAKTNQMAVRLPPAVKDALVRAAAADTRTMSSLVEKILTDWLKSHGFMKTQKGQNRE